MPGTHHIFDILNESTPWIDAGVCVAFGNDRFLKQLAISELLQPRLSDDEDAEYNITRFDSADPTWADVHDELTRRSLFGGQQPPVVVVDQADSFVKNYRDRLENLISPAVKEGKTAKKKNPTGTPAASPASPIEWLLLLVVDSWPSNTNLYKQIDKKFLQIKCDAPLLGKSKINRDNGKIANWLIARAKQVHGYRLSKSAAQIIIDLTDYQFGRMDQELQKLALYVDKQGKLSDETVKQAVGGWSTKTTWEAIAAAEEGNAQQAIELLDQLIRGGEHPLALFGQISWSLRRYAVATEVVYRQVRDRQRPDLRQAINSAGFPSWGNEPAVYEKRLKRMGSKRTSQFAKWLVEADRALKGSHSSDELARQVLENLMIKVAKEG